MDFLLKAIYCDLRVIKHHLALHNGIFFNIITLNNHKEYFIGSELIKYFNFYTYAFYQRMREHNVDSYTVALSYVNNYGLRNIISGNSRSSILVECTGACNVFLLENKRVNAADILLSLKEVRVSEPQFLTIIT